jgi:hypothetical protein
MAEPPSLSPRVFSKKTKRKNISVMKAVDQNKWVSHISLVQSMDELLEFITLWEEVTSVH